VLPSLGPRVSSGGLLLFTLPARCAARRVWPPFDPLAWRPSPAVPSTCLARPPSRRAGGLRPSRPPQPPRVPQGGVGRVGWDAPRLRGSLGFAGQCPSWPTAVCPCVTLWLCVLPRPPSQGARGSGPLYRGPTFGGFIPERPSALPRLPPSSVADGPPASSTGGSGAGRPAFLWLACGGSSGLLHACGLSCC
jgi:hypothetical protein